MYLIQNTSRDSKPHTDLIAILNQFNVYCVQKGRNLDYGSYSVGEEITVTDNKLAYILAQKRDNNKCRDDNAQVALWYYLKNNDTLDKKNIMSNINCEDGIKNTIYNNAETYDNSIKNGTAESQYIVKYRILTSTSKILDSNQDNYNEYNQRLIVVTSVVEENIQKEYKVSLEKYISKVNNINTLNRENKQEYLNIYDFDNSGSFSSADSTYILQYYANTLSDKNIVDNIKEYGDVNGDGEINAEDSTILLNMYKEDSIHNTNLWKHNNVVEVLNGDKIEYTIKVKNDGDTSVKITKIEDYLPNGIKYNNVEYSNNIYNTQTENKVVFENLKDVLLEPGESASFTVNAIVTENNMSTNIMKNVAKITELKNKNNNIVTDSTPEDNEDADYFQMKDISISGMVWNDKALTKSGNYNGIFDKSSEKTIEGIKVKLKRINGDVVTEVANTSTNKEGFYKFELNYIKGPKQINTNRWEGSYYSYIIEFEYDGITYTSTVYSEDVNLQEKKSIAYEDLAKRIEFNNKFSTINNNSGIEYITKNENGYIPQSIHKYNEETMSMTSSTNKIELSNTPSLYKKLKNINLGLRGRDVFDLELICNVQNVKISVNGKEGIYNSNKVEFRNEDIIARINGSEDMANIYKEIEYSNESSSKKTYNIRNTDNKYCTDIKVTYKITIQNTSKSRGTATKVVDYFDNKYSFIRAYNEGGELASTLNEKNGYKEVIITTDGKMLEQSQTTDIYLEFKVSNISEVLSLLLKNENVLSFNMAEIYEYKTECSKEQTEFTRGLLEKDSAPGSADLETVRLKNDSNIEARTTTVKYYFSGENLSILKYEDDTYTMPVICFSSSNNERTLTGTVFKDNTTIDNTTKIKTGNGIIDSGEVGIYGATVELIEQTTKTSYTTTTDKNGVFTINGYIPGNYLIKYSYGDTENTVLLNKSDDSSVNNYSFNGVDYQSTNNTGTYNSKKLNETEKYWYLVNEQFGISTATDDVERRNIVSEKILNFSDENLNLLNNIKTSSLSQEECNLIIENTAMYAFTNEIDFGVEKYVVFDKKVMQSGKFGKYEVSNMNFGISEVPVTIIDLEKHVKSFEILDAAGKNVLASMNYEDGKWATVGDVLGNPLNSNNIDVSIEDNKLQGAKLQITYEVSTNINIEKDFRNTEPVKPTIKEFVDFINNNLKFNPEIGENSKYWEKTEKSIDSSKYSDIVKATKNNPILTNIDGKATATIVLEQVLTAEDTTIEQIITSNVEAFEYNNIVGITELDYINAIQKDRIRNSDNLIIIAGKKNNTAVSEIISIHPPTGDNSLVITNYVKILIGLILIGLFIVIIKKYKK